VDEHLVQRVKRASRGINPKSGNMSVFQLQSKPPLFSRVDDLNDMLLLSGVSVSDKIVKELLVRFGAFFDRSQQGKLSFHVRYSRCSPG
jgi:hypothetical protein